MPCVTFDKIESQKRYSRRSLAALWGYAGYEAIARGVVTPANDCRIILFVTGSKRDQDTQYVDAIADGMLHWDGPNDHFGEQRILKAATTGDEIHLFFREIHRADFIYYGKVAVKSAELFTNRPSRFVFALPNLR